MPSLDKDTFPGWLVVMLKNISEAKAMFPEEIQWLITLETGVLEKVQDPTRKLQELGLVPGAGQGGGMGGMPAGGGAGMPGMPPPGMPPGMGMPGMPPAAGLPGMGAPPPTMGGPPMPQPGDMAQFM